MEQRILQKYHDVKNLAERTQNAGEKKSCNNLLRKLEKKHPNIEFYYAQWIKNNENNSEDSSDEEDEFEWNGFSSFFDRVVSFTEKAFGVRDAISAVQRCTLAKRFNSRSVSITVSIPNDLYENIIVEFNQEQQRVFLDNLTNQIKSSIQQDFSQ